MELPTGNIAAALIIVEPCAPHLCWLQVVLAHSTALLQLCNLLPMSSSFCQPAVFTLTNPAVLILCLLPRAQTAALQQHLSSLQEKLNIEVRRRENPSSQFCRQDDVMTCMTNAAVMILTRA
jgi:hypothetical protein